MKTITYLKKIGIAVMFLFFGTSYVFSQDQSNTDWKLLTTIDDFEVYVQLTECEGAPVYFFKIENDSNTDKNVKLIVDIPSEPTYGQMKFEQKLLANSNSGEICRNSDLTLPRDSPTDVRSLDNIDILLTTK